MRKTWKASFCPDEIYCPFYALILFFNGVGIADLGGKTECKMVAHFQCLVVLD